MDLKPLISSFQHGTEFSEVRFKGDTDRASNVYKGLIQQQDIADIILTGSRPYHINTRFGGYEYSSSIIDYCEKN
jgi:NADP-dependent 3-hydroxy acid dehydrogenase YdfG